MRVTKIRSFYFVYNKDLTSAEIPSSVTNIDYGAFRQCASLKSVQLPKDLTSIGGSAFSECSNLKTVNAPSSLTEIKTSAFRLCITLEEIRYGGTGAQWNNIVFEGSWNASTGDYKVYCTNGTLAKNG